jgi:hypothetical protein
MEGTLNANTVLKQFLGYANFASNFICNYASNAGVQSQMIRNDLKKLVVERSDYECLYRTI